MFTRVYSEYLTKREIYNNRSSELSEDDDFKDYLSSQQQNIYVVLFKNEQESIIRF